MKRIPIESLSILPKIWHKDNTLKPRLRKALTNSEILVEPHGTSIIQKCFRYYNNEWQWAYIPFQTNIQPTLTWNLTTTIGSGLVLALPGIGFATGSHLRFHSNSKESYLIVSNGYGNGTFQHFLYLTQGKEESLSLLSRGYDEVCTFKTGIEGLTIRTEETIGKNQQPSYRNTVTNLPQGTYNVYSYPNLGSLHLCKT